MKPWVQTFSIGAIILLILAFTAAAFLGLIRMPPPMLLLFFAFILGFTIYMAVTESGSDAGDAR